MQRVYFFEFWSMTPHLETSLELAKRHLDSGDGVNYYFCGHDVPYQERLAQYRSSCLTRCLPEVRGAALIESENFHFHPAIYPQEPEWSCPDRFESLQELMTFRHKGCEVGLATASSLIFVTRSSEPDLDRHADLIRTMLRSGIIVYEYVRSVLAKARPDLVYLFNGRFCNSRAVMNAAQDLDIHFRVHERGATKDRYTARPFMPHDFGRVQDEMLEAWAQVSSNKALRQIGHQFFIGRRRGQEQGWTSFTTQQIEGWIPDLAADKKVVTYFASSDDEFRAVGDIVKWDHWSDQRTALQSLIRVCEGLPNVQLIVRLHPHLSKKSIEDRTGWTSLSIPEDAVLVGPEDPVDTYALIERSDLVVTGGSTVGIESVYWGTPSICLGPSIYTKLGAVHVPRDEPELKQMLLQDELEVQPEKTLPYGYYFSEFGEKYRHYRADSLFSGEFLGRNLQRRGWFCRIGGLCKAVAHGQFRRRRPLVLTE